LRNPTRKGMMGATSTGTYAPYISVMINLGLEGRGARDALLPRGNAEWPETENPRTRKPNCLKMGALSKSVANTVSGFGKKLERS